MEGVVANKLMGMASAYGRDPQELLDEALDLWAEAQGSVAPPRSSWSDLPDVLAAIVFNALHGQDAASARLVCTRWAECGFKKRQFLLLSSQNLAGVCMSSTHKDSGMRSLPFPELRSLSLINDLHTPESSAYVLEKICCLPALTSLSLLRAIHQNDADALSTVLPGLQHLHLEADEGGGRSQGHIMGILEKAQQLRRLSVETLNLFTDEIASMNASEFCTVISSTVVSLRLCDMSFGSCGLASLQHIDSLKHLCLERCMFQQSTLMLNMLPTITSLEILQPISADPNIQVGSCFADTLKSLRQLRHMAFRQDPDDINESNQDTTTLLASIVQHTSLTSLEIGMTNMSHDTIRCICRMTWLQSLAIASLPRPVQLSFQFWSELSALKQLQKLSIQGGSIEPSFPATPWPEQPSAVTSLSLIDIRCPVEFISYCAKQPRIQELQVIHCLHEESSLASMHECLSQLSSNLTSLSLIGNSAISLGSLSYIRTPLLCEFETAQVHTADDTTSKVVSQIADLVRMLREFKGALPVLIKAYSPQNHQFRHIPTADDTYTSQKLVQLVQQTLYMCNEIVSF